MNDEKLTLARYITGFVASLFLTLTAYLSVTHHLFGHRALVAAVVVLALIQFAVQLTFFLHLGTETKPRWKLYTFWFMMLVVMIVVFGSIWIINNLDYHHALTPAQVNQYLKSQDGL